MPTTNPGYEVRGEVNNLDVCVFLVTGDYTWQQPLKQIREQNNARENVSYGNKTRNVKINVVKPLKKAPISSLYNFFHGKDRLPLTFLPSLYGSDFLPPASLTGVS